MGVCACWFDDSTHLKAALSLTPTYLRAANEGGMPEFKDWEIPLGRWVGEREGQKVGGRSPWAGGWEGGRDRSPVGGRVTGWVGGWEGQKVGGWVRRLEGLRGCTLHMWVGAAMT